MFTKETRTKGNEARRKPVRIVELNKKFPSIVACAEFLKVKPADISRCLTGDRKGQRIHGVHIEYI